MKIKNISNRGPGSAADAGVLPSHLDTLATPALFADTHVGHIAKDFQRERPDLDLSEFLLSLYAMRLGNIIERKFDSICEERFGVSGSDMRVLFALRRGGRPYAKRPTDLFRALSITSGGVTKKVDRLIAMGFAARMPDPTHAGGFLVQLTRAGLKTADQAIEAILTPLGTSTHPITEEQIREGFRFLVPVLAALEEEEKAANAPVRKRQAAG